MEDQIVTAYAEGMSPSEIAEQFGVDELSVKEVLLRKSRPYREGVKEKKEDVSEGELEEMFDIVKNIARGQQFDNPGVALKAAKFVIDEKKGRNGSADRGGAINVLMFNEELQRVRAGLSERKRSLGLIEVEAKAEAVA